MMAKQIKKVKNDKATTTPIRKGWARFSSLRINLIFLRIFDTIYTKR